MIVVWLFLAVSWGCLQFVIVVFPDHTHLLFLSTISLVFFEEKCLDMYVLVLDEMSKVSLTLAFALLLNRCLIRFNIFCK